MIRRQRPLFPLAALLTCALASGALFSTGVHAEEATNASKPNILFIICDDLNDAVQGFGGHPQTLTPNISRLEERGVRFVNAACNAPLCAPSRPSMLTGLYPHTTGYFGDPQVTEGGWQYAWKLPFFKPLKTWVQYFKENGYDVLGAGKIDHNYAERWSDWTDDKGQVIYGPKPEWGPWPYKGSGQNPDDDFTMNFKLAAPHPAMPQLGNLGYFVSLTNVPTTPPDPKTGFQGYTGWYLYNHPYRYVSETNRDPLPDELLAAYAENFFATRPASGDTRPFFLNIGINRPHEPKVAPEKYFKMFPLDKVELALRKEGDLDDCAPFLYKDFSHNSVSHSSGFGKYQKITQLHLLAEWTQSYLACVAFADDMVGRILDALDKSPYRDNTIVVLVSDNGYHMGQKDYVFKNSAWEESARIPFVVAGPGVAQGKVSSKPVSLVDLYPTFIDLAQLPKQPHPGVNLDGHSIVPLLKNPEQGVWDGPEVNLTALETCDLSKYKDNALGEGKPEAQIYSLRSEQYRYIICPDGGEELYDMKNDPHAWTNLASKPEFDPIRKKMHAQAEALVGKPLGVYYKPNSYDPR